MTILSRVGALALALLLCAPVAAQHASDSRAPAGYAPEYSCTTWSGVTIGDGTLIPCGSGSGSGGGTVSQGAGSTASANIWSYDLRRVGGATFTVGQKAMATSLPVVIASDQSMLPVTFVDTYQTGPIAAATLGASYIINATGSDGTGGVVVSGLTGSGAVLTPQTSIDGTNFVNTSVVPLGSKVPVSTLTADGQYRFTLAARRAFKLVVTTPGVGTITASSTATSANFDPPSPTLDANGYMTANLAVGGTALAYGPQAQAASLPVTLATDGVVGARTDPTWNGLDAGPSLYGVMKYLATGPTASGGNLIGNVQVAGPTNTPAVVSTIPTDGSGISGAGLRVHSFGIFTDGTLQYRARGDLNGAVNQPFALASSRWAFAAPSGGTTSTTALTLMSAGGTGVRNYLTALKISYGAAMGPTEVVVRDGANGTVIYRDWLPGGSVGRATLSFDNPLRGTANTLMEVALLTTVTTPVYINASGFQGN